MNRELIKRLILYIVDQLQDQGGMIGKTRIVKILYLVDVEHYRVYGRILTGLEWVFYHFGPYAYEIDTITKEMGLDLGEEEITTSAGHKGYTYRVQDAQSIDDVVSFANKTMIDRNIEQWALEETKFLLDYVYTATEPMQSATFGHKLDFSRIQRDFDVNRPMRHIQIAKDKSAKIQELLKQRSKTKRRTFSPRYDKTYIEAITAMDQEDEFDGKIAGQIKISPKAAEVISEQIE